MINAVKYQKIDDEGLHFERDGKHAVLQVDHIVICAGQEPLRGLQKPLQEVGIKTHLIGGADEARELDAKRAIDQGARLAAKI